MELIPLVRISSRQELDAFKRRAAVALFAAAKSIDLEAAACALADGTERIMAELDKGNSVLTNVTVRETLHISAAEERKNEAAVPDEKVIPEHAKAVRAMAPSFSLLVPPEYFVVKLEYPDPAQRSAEAMKIMERYYPDVAEKIKYVNAMLHSAQKDYKDMNVVFPEIRADEVFDAAYKLQAQLKSYLIDREMYDELAEDADMSAEDLFASVQKIDITPEASGVFDDYLAQRLGDIALNSADTLSNFVEAYGEVPGVMAKLEANYKSPKVQELVKQLFAAPPATVAELIQQLDSLRTWRTLDTTPGTINKQLTQGLTEKVVYDPPKAGESQGTHRSVPLAADEAASRLLTARRKAFGLADDIQLNLLADPYADENTPAHPASDFISSMVGRTELARIRKEATGAKPEAALVEDFVRSHGVPEGQAEQLMATIGALQDRVPAVNAMYDAAVQREQREKDISTADIFINAYKDAFGNLAGTYATDTARRALATKLIAWMSAAIDEAPEVLPGNVRDYLKAMEQVGNAEYKQGVSFASALDKAVAAENIVDVIDVMRALNAKSASQAPEKKKRAKAEPVSEQQLAEDRLASGGYFNKFNDATLAPGMREFLSDIGTANKGTLAFSIEGKPQLMSDLNMASLSPESASRLSFEVMQDVYARERKNGLSQEEAGALADDAAYATYSSIVSAIDAAAAATKAGSAEWSVLRDQFISAEENATDALNVVADSAHANGMTRDEYLNHIFRLASDLAARNPDLPRKQAIHEVLSSDAAGAVIPDGASLDALVDSINGMLPQYGIGMKPRTVSHRELMKSKVEKLTDTLPGMEKKKQQTEDEKKDETPEEKRQRLAKEKAEEEMEKSSLSNENVFNPWTLVDSLAGRYNNLKYKARVGPAHANALLVKDIQHAYNVALNSAQEPDKKAALASALHSVLSTMTKADQDAAAMFLTPESVEAGVFDVKPPENATERPPWIKALVEPSAAQPEQATEDKLLPETTNEFNEWAELKHAADTMAYARTAIDAAPLVDLITDIQHFVHDADLKAAADAINLGTALEQHLSSAQEYANAAHKAAKAFSNKAEQANKFINEVAAYGEAEPNALELKRLSDAAKELGVTSEAFNAAGIESNKAAAINALDLGVNSAEADALSTFMRSYINRER